MTYETDCTLPEELLEQIAQQGLDVLPDIIRTVINTAMQAERQEHLSAAPYERTTERQGHANGYKPKTVTTRVGKITFDVPQVRDGSFYPQSLEKGLRSERALKLALAEMYVQGVSTRKVAAITEQLCGTEISSTQVSRATAELDEQFAAWRERPLGQMPYLYLDARYEKVRQDGQVRNAAVLMAMGVNLEGKREVLGVSVSLGEHEVHWRTFLQSLVARGLTGVQLVISDDHGGLQQARLAVFGGVPWQRCQCHLQRNAQAYVPKRIMKREVAADMRAIFNAASRHDTETLLAQAVKKYSSKAAALADWMEMNVPEGLTIFAFPSEHHRRIRTTNSLERLNREFRRRSRVNDKGLGQVEWVEEHVSGRVSWRKRRLATLLDRLENGDTLIVSELSRLGRSMLECMEIPSIASQKGVYLYAVKGNWQLDGTIQSKIIAMSFAMAAEIERDFISQRTREALAARKQAGKKLGRPKGSGKSKLDKYQPEIEALMAHGSTQKFIAERYGTTEANLSRWLKKHGLRRK